MITDTAVRNFYIIQSKSLILKLRKLKLSEMMEELTLGLSVTYLDLDLAHLTQIAKLHRRIYRTEIRPLGKKPVLSQVPGKHCGSTILPPL